MQKRKFDELVSYFNKKVSEMEIETKYKMELLGMVTALGCAYEKEMSDLSETKRDSSDTISRQAAIDALKEHEDDKGYLRGDFEEILEALPSAEPVRCKDCYYCVSYNSFDKTYYCCDAFEAHAEGDLIGVSLQVDPNHYCSWAERRRG